MTVHDIEFTLHYPYIVSDTYTKSRVLHDLNTLYHMRSIVGKGVVLKIHDYHITYTYLNNSTNTFHTIMCVSATCFHPTVGDIIPITPDILRTIKETPTGDIYQVHNVLVFVRTLSPRVSGGSIELIHVSVKLHVNNGIQYRCIGRYV